MHSKIVPHIWFNTQAKEAIALYVSLFADSKINHIATIPDTPSGDCDMVTFTLAGQNFMAISAGPYFTLNPAISLFVTFETEDEIGAVWEKLSAGGKILMPYNTYPWAQKYGWLQDRYGLSWQLSMSDHHDMKQKITPMMMFTQKVAGKVREAIDFYSGIFPESETEMLVPYEKNEGDTEGFIKHGRFTLCGQHFMAMDSSGPHEFTFNEGVSLVVNCDTQEEIDHYWEKLSAVPEAEQCGWLKDQYGISWQIVPSRMEEMMSSGDQEKTARVTQAFLTMKKFDIQKLEEAYNQK